ncbi:glycosyltransferase [Ekhidna sp.]|uniref:glycosyltransferase n=1 Tax=Ekhidna sp. TaxID=2608089 RepID=UPI003BA91D1E
MKILHITSWFPHKENPKEALFIERHIAALGSIKSIDQTVLHLSMNPGAFRFRKEKSFLARHIQINIPVKKWIVIELLSFVTLCWSLLRVKANTFDIINFHVAYPNLTFWHWVKRWVKPKTVITEHWSAYHFNFGLSKPPPRIKRIFRQNIPVISVSKALMHDIETFSEAKFPQYLVPNIVDTSVFKPNKKVNRKPNRLFMVAQWKKPKNPFLILQAFHSFSQNHHKAELIIGGYGPLLDEMKRLVSELKLTGAVNFLGKMNSEEIAFEMQQAAGFIHSSEYETFSIVCAEALSCGCPVIASKVGGIPEFVNETNGVLVEDQSEHAFSEAMRKLVSSNWSVETNDAFSPKKVAKTYYDVLNAISR